MNSLASISASLRRRACLARRAACCAAAVGGMMLASSVGAQVIPSELPPPVRGLSVTNTLGQQAPLYLQFKNEQGQIVSLKDYFNRTTPGAKGARPVVMQMLYYRCPILCPQVLTRLTNTLNEIDLTVGKDFDVVLVSFDPRDTPKDAADHKSTQLIAYNRASQQVADGWTFLTSTPDSAQKLGEALGFPFRALENGEFSHGAALYILTPEGRISRSLIGLNYPAADVKLALLEAGGGKIGTWKDAFVLWCYHFDPTAGTYTVAAMRVMRVAALITIVFVGSLIAALWRFEKRKRLARQAEMAGRTVAPATPPPVFTPAAAAAHRLSVPASSVPFTGSTP